MAPTAARKASEALKGAPVPAPAEEAQLDLPATETDAKAAADKEAADKAAAEAEAAKEADEAKVTADVEATHADEQDDTDDLVEATVVIAMFNYFAEDGTHLSALKGTKVHVEPDVAARGVRIGALTVQD
ncbi:putative structural protein [Arthrobacter phage vB_ArtM-ArV1]|uniref:Putative structural protein n=1 Tax=Arthrobacter phage vB_ArtM-ArV1 TaxID=1566993 RepID=A0A0A7HAU5_9CAUD|nr:putative structural protein [Arthrobacter phage vB_ArtM-ArV1]AIZ01698.1 putative structural protein [Arthrobacter phage vB_ArtM-ArV1]